MSDPTRFFATWREQELEGSRRVLDGLVAAGHRGPSAELATFLSKWPGAWYWGDDARHRLVLIRGSAPARPERWIWHGALLAVTVVTTLAAGAILAHSWRPPAHGPGVSGMVAGVIQFGEFVVQGGWRQLLPGWSFAVPLLAILLIHELGHYLAARRYAIDVSPPYFLPVPPTLSPIGNLGAFIRIRTPVYDRRQLLDVGAAGPLAGFVVALVVLWWGYKTSTRLDVPSIDSPSLVAMIGEPVRIGESILTRALRDFGHVLYGLLGRRQNALSLLAVAVLIWLGFRAPMWWVWVALTFVIGRGGWSHPSVVVPQRGVLAAGRVTGIACLIVFLLTFVPVPFAG